MSKFPKWHPLVRDNWIGEDEPELSVVNSHRIADVTRAADGIKALSRLAHNSLGEPEMSGAQPLGIGMEQALLDAIYCLGDYIFEHMDGMRETAQQHRKLEREVSHG